MDELSRYVTILVLFSFILTILGFAYNLSLTEITRPKYLIHLLDNNSLLQSSFHASRDFTVKVDVSHSGSTVTKANLYVLVGGAQSKINESKTLTSFSNFTKALSYTLYLSPSEISSLNFHFYIDDKKRTLLINYNFQNTTINLNDSNTLRIVFVITGSEKLAQEPIYFYKLETAWVLIRWGAS